MTQTSTLKNKLTQNSRHLRLVSRANIFQKNRKTYDQLDYLHNYSPQQIQIILNSMQGPIPNPLPPLSPSTISYYRRKSQPLFKTKLQNQTHLDHHMTYQSLWILAGLEDRNYTHQKYQAAIKEFEQNFKIYINSNSNDIRQMAIIAAGNKIIGKSQDIIQLVSVDTRQLWVLINHIYEKKINLEYLFPYLDTSSIQKSYEIAFKTIYQFTNQKKDQAISAILYSQVAIISILKATAFDQENIRKYAIRIIGNIAADSPQYIQPLIKAGLLDQLCYIIQSSDSDTRRDGCWVISNIVCDKFGANSVLKNNKLLNKLIQMYYSQGIQTINIQLTYVFLYLIHFGDKTTVFTLFCNDNIVVLCEKQLLVDDGDLNYVTLLLIKQLLQLGSFSKNDINPFIGMIKRCGSLYNQISNKSFDKQQQIYSISQQIIGLLDDQQNQY